MALDLRAPPAATLLSSSHSGAGMTGPQPEDIAKRDQGLWTRKKAPIGFDDSIEYVTKVKTRFAKEPETYKAFLEILRTYQKEKTAIKEVKEQVLQLFEHHGDLTLGFNRFLPPGYAMARWRMVSRVIGPLMLAWRRAADRAYAPGGVGFDACRQEFAALAGIKLTKEVRGEFSAYRRTQLGDELGVVLRVRRAASA